MKLERHPCMTWFIGSLVHWSSISKENYFRVTFVISYVSGFLVSYHVVVFLLILPPTTRLSSVRIVVVLLDSRGGTGCCTTSCPGREAWERATMEGAWAWDGRLLQMSFRVVGWWLGHHSYLFLVEGELHLATIPQPCFFPREKYGAPPKPSPLACSAMWAEGPVDNPWKSELFWFLQPTLENLRKDVEEITKSPLAP